MPIITYSYCTKLILIYFNVCALNFARCAITVVDGAHLFVNKNDWHAHCAPYIAQSTCCNVQCAWAVALCAWKVALVTYAIAHSACLIAQGTNHNKMYANSYAHSASSTFPKFQADKSLLYVLWLKIYCFTKRDKENCSVLNAHSVWLLKTLTNILIYLLQRFVF